MWPEDEESGGEPFVGTAITIIRITPSELVCKMIPGNSELIRVGYNQNFTLCANKYSFDPDVPSSQDQVRICVVF